MKIRASEKITTEILVIGSGAGGATTAATLAEAGHAVLILEEGPAFDTSHLATHSPEAIGRLYRHAGLSPLLGNANIAFVEGRCVGGSTEINSAFWQRTPSDALERWRKVYQVGELSLESLQEIFEEIEQELNVAYLDAANPPPSSARLRDGAERLGWLVKEIPRSQTTNLQGSAFAPGAKRSMSRAYLPRAIQAGAQLRADCRVTRLHYQAGRISHVTARQNGPDGPRTLYIAARQVFVCAGPIQTPALLRASGLCHNIGESLYIHPMLKVAAQFDRPMDSHRSTLPIFQVKEFWPEITLGGSVFTPGYLALTLADSGLKDAVLPSDWRNMALYYAACRGTGRGRVRALPITGEAVASYNLSKQDRASLSAGLARLGEVLFAAGAQKLYPALQFPIVLENAEQGRAFLDKPLPAAAMSLSTVHAFSSCPMGQNQKICATDSFGRVYGFENLFIADASLIPDAPGVNPQGTVMALALRNARHFSQSRKSASRVYSQV